MNNTIYLLSLTEYLDDVLPGCAAGKHGLIEIAYRACMSHGSKRRNLAILPFELTDKTLIMSDSGDHLTFYIHTQELVA